MLFRELFQKLQKINFLNFIEQMLWGLPPIKIFRGVFRTQSNIYDVAFLKK